MRYHHTCETQYYYAWVFIVALLCYGFLIWSVFGAEINFLTPILDADNNPITECADRPLPKDDRDCLTRIPLTLGAVSMRALTVPEQNLSPEDNLKRGQLALNVYKSPGADLTAEEISIIKKQIAKSFGPLIAVRAFPILDPATAKK